MRRQLYQPFQHLYGETILLSGPHGQMRKALRLLYRRCLLLRGCPAPAAYLFLHRAAALAQQAYTEQRSQERSKCIRE